MHLITNILKRLFVLTINIKRVCDVAIWERAMIGEGEILTNVLNLQIHVNS